MRLNATDVYLNIAGGLRVSEPAADLAVAAALVSAAFDQPTNAGMVYFGEIGLSGEIRQVAQADVAAEGGGQARASGRPRCRAGSRAATGQPAAPEGLELAEIGHISDLVARFAPEFARLRMIVAWRRALLRPIKPPAPLRGGSMTWVDLVVLAVLAVSALLAFMRGLVREVLGLAAWVGAIFAGVWALPRVRPQFQEWLGASPWIDPVAFGVVFLITPDRADADLPLDRRAGARLADRWP